MTLQTCSITRGLQPSIDAAIGESDHQVMGLSLALNLADSAQLAHRIRALRLEEPHYAFTFLVGFRRPQIYH